MNHRNRYVAAGAVTALATIGGLLLTAPTTNADMSETRRGVIEITISNDAWPEEPTVSLEETVVPEGQVFVPTDTEGSAK